MDPITIIYMHTCIYAYVCIYIYIYIYIHTYIHTYMCINIHYIYNLNIPLYPPPLAPLQPTHLVPRDAARSPFQPPARLCKLPAGQASAAVAASGGGASLAPPPLPSEQRGEFSRLRAGEAGPDLGLRDFPTRLQDAVSKGLGLPL